MYGLWNYRRTFGHKGYPLGILLICALIYLAIGVVFGAVWSYSTLWPELPLSPSDIFPTIAVLIVIVVGWLPIVMIELYNRYQ